MHEGNYTGRIVGAILGELKRVPGRKVRLVRVLVGQMLHLNSESVKMHFEMLVEGTALQGVEVLFKEEPVKVRCRRCEREVALDDHHHLACPACGVEDVELMGGNEVFIESIEFEDRSPNRS